MVCFLSFIWGGRKKRFRTDKLNPKAFVTARVISFGFRHSRKPNCLYAAAPLSSKAAAFDEKGETGLISDTDFLNQLNENRLVSTPERFSLFVAKRYKSKKNRAL